MKILCFFGFHKWKKTTQSTSINGTVKEYFKCRICSKKRQYQYNPNARHACGVCSQEVGTCGCNDC